MHYAAKSGSRDVIKFLLDNRANPDIVDDSGDTPINLIEGSIELQDMMQRHSDQTKQKHKKN